MNAGFDVPLEDSCLDGVSGNLQVGAGVAPSRCALVAETDRLHVMLESGGAGAVSSGDRPAVVAAGVSLHRHGASAGAPAWQVRSACVNVRLVLNFVLPLDFHGRVRVVRSMYLPAALHGIEASC